MEVWKPTFYSDKYEVSSLGKVRRIGKIDCLKINYDSTGGYGRVNIGKSMVVHKIVALTFIGNRPDGMDINHIDGDKKNNSIDNLQFVTRSENCRQACNEQGLRKMYGKHHNKTRLSPEDIKTIKERISKGDKNVRIAEEYNVDASTISQIKRRKEGYYASI